MADGPISRYLTPEEKLQLAIKELEQCRIDLFEAEDKFHILSYYINDGPAWSCAKQRVTWMNKAGERVKTLLEGIK